MNLLTITVVGALIYTVGEMVYNFINEVKISHNEESIE